jgi:predicted proteasome-type protease
LARRGRKPAQPGERVFILLSSGSLSCTQSIITLLRCDFDEGKGLAQAPSLYDAARIIGEEVRRVSDMDRAALERDDFKFNVNLIVGGQVRPRRRRFTANDPDLVRIGVRWDQAVRQAVARLPQIRFRVARDAGQPPSPQEESIVLVEPPNPFDPAAVQASQRPPERG